LLLKKVEYEYDDGERQKRPLSPGKAPALP
jgi:hypothetical protein